MDEPPCSLRSPLGYSSKSHLPTPTKTPTTSGKMQARSVHKDLLPFCICNLGEKTEQSTFDEWLSHGIWIGDFKSRGKAVEGCDSYTTLEAKYQGKNGQNETSIDKVDPEVEGTSKRLFCGRCYWEMGGKLTQPKKVYSFDFGEEKVSSTIETSCSC